MFQKVRSSEYYSFNVLGISIILFVGLFFMLLAGFIETIATSIGNRFDPDKQHNPPYSRLEWDCNSYFDLQRLAHQALGVGTWSRSRTGIPVTALGEQLGVVGTGRKSTLPVLRRPKSENELQDVTGRSNHKRYSSGDYILGTGYPESVHSPYDHLAHKGSKINNPMQDSDSTSIVPSRYFRRPGYARIRTDEPSIMHMG